MRHDVLSQCDAIDQTLTPPRQPFIIWLTGLSGAGKSTIAQVLEKALTPYCRVKVLDGDDLRKGINGNLGFSREGRRESVRRASEVGRLFCESNFVVIAALISPFNDDRVMARYIMHPFPFFEVFVDTPLSACEKRDPKGLYRKKREDGIAFFTGYDSEYQAPIRPDVHLKTADNSIQECVFLVVEHVIRQGLLGKSV